MFKNNLIAGSIVVLVAGIALATFGYFMEPTVGDSIDNVFTGDFTDKRNILMLVGLIVALAGVVGLVSGAINGRNRLRSA